MWRLQIQVSDEPPFHKIENLDIWVGRRLLPKEMPEEIDMIIDLTSEFPKIDSTKSYINIPLLDGINPPRSIVKSVKQVAEKIKKEKLKIYIHCAQGHGRTATFTSLLLVELGLAENPLGGYEKVREARPKAKVSSSQKRFLEE